MTKRQVRTLIIILLVIAVAIIIYAFRCKLFKVGCGVEDPNKSNTPVPTGSPTTTWVVESFPLNVGMYGAMIKSLQEALGIEADGKFGTQTKSSVQGKGYTVPLSKVNYDKIVGGTTITPTPKIKGAYSKYDGQKVRDKSFNEKRVVNKDQYIGRVTGEDIQGTYWEIDGIEYVIKTSTYIVG